MPATLPRVLVDTGGIIWCLDRATQRIGATLRNLHQETGGYPSTSPGNGDPGAGKGGTGDPTAAVAFAPDRAADVLDELRVVARAAEAKARLLAMIHRPDLGPQPQAPDTFGRVVNAQRLAIALVEVADVPRRHLDALHRHADRLERITTAWGYTPAPPRKPTRDDLADDGLAHDLTELWCRSCLRAGHREPRSDRYTTSGLCRWCGDFAAHEGFMAPQHLVDAHNRGQRITEAEVARYRPATGRKGRKGRR